jgi:hypothetical protein
MRVAHISSTFYGGGVTELLTPLTAQEDVELDIRLRNSGARIWLCSELAISYQFFYSFDLDKVCADFVFDQERNIYVCPGGAELTSTGNIDQGHIVYYRASKSDLLALFIEAEVHDGDRAQNHPRPQRRCAGSCPCVGQYGSLPAVAPRRKKVDLHT